MDDIRFPTGKFQRPTATLTDDQRREMIGVIASTPGKVRAAVAGLSDSQLDTPYRDGGWTLRQVVHHLPDSHINAYVRFRWALTEEAPTMKVYDQAAWAELPDARAGSIDVSLAMLDAVHERWVRLLRAMTPEDFVRELSHPEKGPMTLDALLATYAWHGPHHTAHITELRKRMGWS